MKWLKINKQLKVTRRGRVRYACEEETRSYMYDTCIERRSGRIEKAGSMLRSERIRSNSGYTSQADFMKRAGTRLSLIENDFGVGVEFQQHSVLHSKCSTCRPNHVHS